MLDKTKALTVIAIIFMILALTAPVFGGTITFSTMHADVNLPPLIPGHGLTAGVQDPTFTWNYTGNYADTRLNTSILDFNNNNQVTICTNGACGSENYGFNRTYTGYEFIYFGFALPADAFNVVLDLAYAAIDDRAIVDLNGNTLGGWGGTYIVAPGTTAQQLDGSGFHTVAFTGPNTANNRNFSTQSWFTPGAENYIRFWMNNTNGGINGATQPHLNYYEPSALQTYGTITFDQGEISAVPEPGSAVLIGLGSLTLGLISLRRLKGS